MKRTFTIRPAFDCPAGNCPVPGCTARGNGDYRHPRSHGWTTESWRLVVSSGLVGVSFTLRTPFCPPGRTDDGGFEGTDLTGHVGFRFARGVEDVAGLVISRGEPCNVVGTGQCWTAFSTALGAQEWWSARRWADPTRGGEPEEHVWASLEARVTALEKEVLPLRVDDPLTKRGCAFLKAVAAVEHAKWAAFGPQPVSTNLLVPPAPPG